MILLALLQVSVAAGPSLDAARQCLRAADTSAAVATLIAVTEADTVLGSDDIAALLLLRWLGRGPTQPRAAAAWDEAVRGGGRFFLGETGPEWSRTGLVFFTAKQVERGVSDRAVDSLARGAMIRYLRPWQSRLREIAELEEARDPLLGAAARWTALRGWLANLDRFARWVPMIPPPIGCEHGCALRRSPPADLPLARRLLATGDGSWDLDTLFLAANDLIAMVEVEPDSFIPLYRYGVGRTATLDSLWLSLDQLQGRSPWPFNELAERLRVTLCAVLKLRAEGYACTPLTRDLDSVVGLELKAVRFEFEGRRGLAARAMDEAVDRFVALDELVDLLPPDSTPAGGGRRAAPPAGLVRQSGTTLTPWFWQTAWPLYLVPYNERLVAHRARLLLADMSRRLATAPEQPGLFDGYGDPGTLVRIGVPAALARPVGPAEGRFPLITYMALGTHETIVRAGPGMRGVSLDFALAARSGVHPTTVSGFAAEGYDTFEALEHQVVRYRRAGQAHIELYTRWGVTPGCRAPRPLLAFFLLDAQLRQVSRPTQFDPTQPPALKRVHLQLAPGAYVYSLELLDRGCRRAERARYVLTVPPDADQRASDLMLASELHFGGDRWVGRVAERPPVTVRPSLTVPGGDVAWFYWELYDLAANAMEAGRVTVTFEVVNVRQERVLVREIRQAAAEARRRPGTLDIRYELTVPPGTGPLGFGLAVGIPEGTRGLHVARARVTDARTKREVVVERAFFVSQ